MKNKEIEELLNNIKKQLIIDEKLGKEIAQDFHQTTLNYKEIKLLLSYIEQLEEEIHKKEAMYDSLAVDYRLSQEQNEQLENNRDKAFEYIESHFIFDDKTGECYQTHTFDKDNVKKLYDILKGDSDENIR